MRLLFLLAVLMPVLAFPQDVDGGVAAPPEPDAGTVTGPSVSAKFGSGVTVRQGEFSLTVRGRVQFQALAVVPGAESTAARLNELLVRRARLSFRGEAPWHLSFTLQLAFGPLDMEPDAPNVLRDFYVDWKPLRDVHLRVGQTKVPFGLQRVISSSSQSFVDRSTVTGELNLDRDMGLIVSSDDLFGWGGRLRYALGVFGGDGRNRSVANVGLLYAARLRLANVGWDDKFEGDLERDERFRVALGAAVARNVATNRPRSTIGTPYQASTFDYTHAEVDLHLKWRGLALLGELTLRQADQDQATHLVKGVSLTEYSRSGLGWFAQAGYAVVPWLEFVGRYGELRPTATTDPSFHRSREVGGGVNVYFLAHDLKLQADYFWLDDGTGGNGRHQLRMQAQLAF